MMKFGCRALMGLITTCLVLLICAAGARVQVETGRFVGRITDPQGALVPNAVVKATNLGTNIVQTATTNSDGEFVITPSRLGSIT